MTIAQFFELLLSKFCVNYGIESKISPFAEIDVDIVKDLLMRAGLESTVMKYSIRELQENKCI